MKLSRRSLIALVFCFSLFAGHCFVLFAQDSEGEDVPAGPLTLVTLGDSLTEGDGDELGQGGYPGRLLTMIEPIYPDSTLTNVGHSGWNSDALINGDQGLPGELDQAVEVIQAAVEGGNQAVALVWIGSNDLFYLYEYGDPDDAAETEDLAHYEANLDHIAGALRDAGASIIIAQLDDQSQRPVTQAGLAFTGISKDEVENMGQQVVRYNEAIARVAEKYGASTVDFYSTTLFTDPETLSDDGNHPNADGYVIVAQHWFDALIQHLEAPTIEKASLLLDDTLLKDTALLDDDPCAAPCWLNIIPGETSWEETQTMIQQDGRFESPDEIRGENSDARLLSFVMKGSPNPCCRIYSSLDGTKAGPILLLLAPNQMSLGDIIAKYGDPAYGTGDNVSDDEALISLVYPEIPLVVHAFVPGIEDGALMEDSPIIGATYFTSEDIVSMETTNNWYTWTGYGPVAEWLDEANLVMPDAEATAEP